jgi:hypothetical protein
MARFPNTHLSPRDPNKFATTNMINELVTAANAGQPPFVTGQQRPPNVPQYDLLALLDTELVNGVANEMYYGHVQSILSGDGAAAVAITLALQDDGQSIKIAICNTAEQYFPIPTTVGFTPGSGTHLLGPSTIFVPVRVRIDGGGNVRYTMHVPPPLIVPVTCAVDGGSNGSSSSTTTYTYGIATVYGAALNTGQVPALRRTTGAVLSATFGYAHVDPFGTKKYVLGYCNEVLDIETCST